MIVRVALTSLYETLPTIFLSSEISYCRSRIATVYGIRNWLHRFVARIKTGNAFIGNIIMHTFLFETTLKAIAIVLNLFYMITLIVVSSHVFDFDFIAPFYSQSDFLLHTVNIWFMWKMFCLKLWCCQLSLIEKSTSCLNRLCSIRLQ